MPEKTGDTGDWQGQVPKEMKEKMEKKIKEKLRKSEGKSKAEELKEVSEGLGPLFETLSEKLPMLLDAVYESLYSEKAARQLGKAVGTFYQELRAGGIPEEEALSMARGYMDKMKDVFREGSFNLNE